MGSSTRYVPWWAATDPIMRVNRVLCWTVSGRSDWSESVRRTLRGSSVLPCLLLLPTAGPPHQASKAGREGRGPCMLIALALSFISSPSERTCSVHCTNCSAAGRYVPAHPSHRAFPGVVDQTTLSSRDPAQLHSHFFFLSFLLHAVVFGPHRLAACIFPSQPPSTSTLARRLCHRQEW